VADGLDHGIVRVDPAEQVERTALLVLVEGAASATRSSAFVIRSLDVSARRRCIARLRRNSAMKTR
jgi:hypothetical protein